MADPAPLNGQSIRYVIIDELPHYHAADIILALGISVDTLAARVADEHYRLVSVTIEDGSEEKGLVLTPIGVWTLGLYQDRSMCAKVRAWVFRETKALRPDAFDRAIHGAAQMMALRPDGDVPPKPDRYSGRQDEWLNLKFLPRYNTRPRRRDLFTVGGYVRGRDMADAA